MKRMTKIIAIVLAISLLCAVPVSAEETVTPYASAFFSATETYLYEISGNKFGVWFEVLAKNTMDELGVSSIVMQRSINGTTWSDVKTFYPESYSQMISKNDVYHGDGVTYSGTYNYYYRAYVEFYAKKGVNSGYLYRYTDVLHLVP